MKVEWKRKKKWGKKGWIKKWVRS